MQMWMGPEFFHVNSIAFLFPSNEEFFAAHKLLRSTLKLFWKLVQLEQRKWQSVNSQEKEWRSCNKQEKTVGANKNALKKTAVP